MEKTKYVVAKGKAFQTKGGYLKAGDEISAKVFDKESSFAAYLKNGWIVEVTKDKKASKGDISSLGQNDGNAKPQKDGNAKPQNDGKTEGKK